MIHKYLLPAVAVLTLAAAPAFAADAVKTDAKAKPAAGAAATTDAKAKAPAGKKKPAMAKKTPAKTDAKKDKDSY